MSWDIEIFKPIAGYEGYYEVSTLGRVKSLLRIVERGVVGNRLLKEIIMKPNSDKDGYLKLTLRKGKGNSVTRRIHRLVAETFIPNPMNYPTVNHLNGIKTDNEVNNLEWTTYKTNAIHRNKVLGRKRITINYTPGVIEDVVNSIDKGESVISLCKRLKISDKAIRRIYKKMKCK